MPNLFDTPVTIQLPEDAENMKLPSPEMVNFYKDLNDRVLWINFDIDEGLLEYSKYILNWNKEDKDIPIEERKPIRLLIFSYGGSADITNHFIDILKLSKTPIIGINMGVAMSAGFFILIACKERFALKNSTVLIHEGSGGATGTAEQIIQDVENYKRDIKLRQQFIIDNTSISPAVMRKNSKRDWYIDSKNQIKYGIVSKLIEDIDEII